MNWVQKKSMPAIKSISYKNCPCNTLPDLWHALHNSYNSAANRPVNTRFLNEILQATPIEWPAFSKQEFRDTIAKCSLSSALGPNHISWRHLKTLFSSDLCLEKIVNVTNAYINLEVWPFHFKTANTVIIPKPNKESYSTPKSFHPIVLLNTTGKLIEKVISNHLQFHIVDNGFLNPNQLGSIRQRSTTDAGIYLTYLIRAGWLKQCHTSIIAFDIAQFFPSLNHSFLFTCLKKAGLNTNVMGFFDSYHTGHSTSYSWNQFSSPYFNINVGVGQDSALSPILFAIYLALIIKTFKKRIKNLKESIPTDILSFVDNSLLISQEKSYALSSSFLLCSYNIMSKILLDSGLIIEHSKTELFHFPRACHPPNPSIDLLSVGGPVIFPKPIWQYLGFFFDHKLNFHYHMHYYATKCLFTLSTIKMLGNSSRGLLPIQKQLLYRTCVLPIALYGFQLWFFKGAPTIRNMTELKKMQWRAAL